MSLYHNTTHITRPLSSLQLPLLSLTMALNAYNSAFSIRPTPPSDPPLTNPNDVSLDASLRTSVLGMLDGNDPENTKKALEPKMKEYFHFCSLVYPSDQCSQILTKDRVYRFMYYQAFREKKKSGGKRRAQDQPAFDLEGYNGIISRLSSPGSGDDATAYPAPLNPINPCTFDQYKATFRRIYSVQKAKGYLAAQWDDIWTRDLNDLRKHVLNRAPKRKKETYQEKVTGEFSPYTYVGNFDSIEQELWNSSTANAGHRCIAAGLRHRYCLLHLTSGILRSESLYRAELSDFCGVFVPGNDRDAHQMFLMVNQIPFGKTNHGRILYGRATRHRDVRLCCVGALSCYLQYRFHVTEEFADFTVEDWCDNQKWFDVKLLVDVGGPLFVNAMKNDSYSNKLKLIVGKLKLPTHNLLHLGRKLGPKILDILGAGFVGSLALKKARISASRLP